VIAVTEPPGPPRSTQSVTVKTQSAGYGSVVRSASAAASRICTLP